MSSPNPFADESPRPAGRPQSAADPLNPYASPAGGAEYLPQVGPGIGIWRSGDYVVLHEAVHFPDRCIWTNEPGGRRQAISLNYRVLYGLSQASLTFDYSMSPESCRKHTVDELLTFAILVGGIAAWIGGATKGDVFGTTVQIVVVLLGVVLTIVGAVLGFRSRNLLAIIHHEGPYFVIHGPREPFLRSLPKWPGMNGR